MTEHLARLQKARINLLLDEPFFGSLMMQLKPVEDPKVPRFRTNGTKLWFNPAYLDTLSDAQLRTVLAHEVMHPALLHPFRLGDRDLRTANIAADYAINNFLDQYNLDAQKRGETPPFVWPIKLDANGQPTTTPDVLLNHAYDNHSFEEIYAALTHKPPAGGGQQQGRAGGAGIPPGPQPGQPSQGQQPGTGQPSPGTGSSDSQSDQSPSS